MTKSDNVITVKIPYPRADKISRQQPAKLASKTTTNTYLIKALTKAYLWQKQLDQGKFSSVTALAKHYKVSSTYAGKLLQINLLAPKIKLAILKCQQPATLRLENLIHPFPLLWDEQVRFFGLAD